MVSMSESDNTPPNLDARFFQPKGYEFQFFERRGSQRLRKIRYGIFMPKNPKGIIIHLPGLSEFAEKYYELASNIYDQNYGYVTIDWVGQGKSSRYMDNAHKRHADPFDEDVEDLHALITQYIPDHTPLFMLAHSMGGNLGMRYALKHPRTFQAIGLSAPMFGIKAVSALPIPFRHQLSSFLNSFFSEKYVFGGMDWNEHMRGKKGIDIFSSDPIRGKIHHQWSLADEELRLGAITYGWVEEALQSCSVLFQDPTLKSLETPIFIGMAEKEALVDNHEIHRAHSMLLHSELIEFSGAQHEILVEIDEIRGAFLKHYFSLVEKTLQNVQNKANTD